MIKSVETTSTRNHKKLVKNASSVEMIKKKRSMITGVDFLQKKCTGVVIKKS